MVRMIKCKKCGKVYPSNISHCPECFEKNNQYSLSILIGILVFIFVFCTMMIFFLSDDSFSDNSDGTLSEAVEDSLYLSIGETLNANGLKITCQKAEDWNSGNIFIMPNDGYKFIRVYFVMENTNSLDYVMGGLDFECYADNSKMKMSIYGDNEIDLYSTISSGRKLEGYIYFEVPKNAEEIEIEYETNFWTDKKAYFKVK